jgi:hypothetical protein
MLNALAAVLNLDGRTRILTVFGKVLIGISRHFAAVISLAKTPASLMEHDNPACLPAAAPAGGRSLSTPSGCRRNPLAGLGILGRAWRGLLNGALRAPPWTFAVVAGVGLATAVLLALS